MLSTSPTNNIYFSKGSIATKRPADVRTIEAVLDGFKIKILDPYNKGVVKTEPLDPYRKPQEVCDNLAMYTGANTRLTILDSGCALIKIDSVSQELIELQDTLHDALSENGFNKSSNQLEVKAEDDKVIVNLRVKSEERQALEETFCTLLGYDYYDKYTNVIVVNYCCI